MTTVLGDSHVHPQTQTKPWQSAAAPKAREKGDRPQAHLLKDRQGARGAGLKVASGMHQNASHQLPGHSMGLIKLVPYL